jgi:hypothetical protein
MPRDLNIGATCARKSVETSGDIVQLDTARRRGVPVHTLKIGQLTRKRSTKESIRAEYYGCPDQTERHKKTDQSARRQAGYQD